MNNIVYSVIGYQEDENYPGEYYPYFYGVFSSEENARKVLEELEASPYRDEKEMFTVEMNKLDTPTDLYYLSTK